MIRFNCKNCGQNFKVSNQQAGKKGKCPKCKQPIAIPSAGEDSAQESSIIKFHCPNCNQKIGVSTDYAGKRVRCAKCKNPLRVPQVSGQSEPPVVKDETTVLRAGQEQRPTEKEIWGNPGDMDELLLAETNAPPLEKQMEQSEVNYESRDSGFSAYPSQLPESAAPVERAVSRDRPKKKRTAIFVGAGGVLVLLLVSIVVWNFLSDSGGSKSEMEVELYEVREFTEDYIGLLNEGKIDKARELLSPELQANVKSDEFERFAKQIGKSKIVGVDCELTHFEEHPEGNQFYLLYNLRYEDNEQSVVVSVIEIDEDLRVAGIAVQGPFGNAISIGPNSYEELSDVVLAAAFEKFGSLFTKFFGSFLLIALVFSLIQTVSMWIVFNKAGQPGWAAIVPYYNMWVLAEVADKPGWLGLLFCFGGAIPFVGPIVVLVLWVVISIGVARAFDRGVGFGIGLTLVPFIFYPILAFASD